uniref:Uncharacterized protein n=1 Tax=Trichogramma kaykai TaxID=54128 RepID=A0ABD2WTQ2_9HYME
MEQDVTAVVARAATTPYAHQRSSCGCHCSSYEPLELGLCVKSSEPPTTAAAAAALTADIIEGDCCFALPYQLLNATTASSTRISSGNGSSNSSQLRMYNNK